MKGITKSFPGVLALQDVHFNLLPGEVHALVGENGAGKSTLCKIMTGIYSEFEGTYEYQGKPANFKTIADAQKAGVSIVHQELNMLNDLTVAQNIFIGRESDHFFLSDKQLNRQAASLIKEYDIEAKPNELLRNLSVGKAQMVEIARAMSYANTRVLILDEPTASLSENEVQELLDKVRKLRARGLSVVYISHRMDEIKEISDRITILRDGQFIDTLETKDTSSEEIIRRMVGRDISNTRKTASSVPPDAEVVLGARNLHSPDVKNAAFDLRKGEILGVAGLIGAGRTEAMRILCGADPQGHGDITLHGKKVHFTSPKDAIEHGIAYLSEDRKRYGLLTSLSIVDNIALPSYDKFSKGIVVNDKSCRKASQRFVDLLKVKTPSIQQTVKNLSGGNQQKVVLAKWLVRDVEILIFDEPTRGIDIGARSEIYDLMRDLIRQGKSIILVSSDLTEILHLSDRIIVMCEGNTTGSLDISEATEPKIMELATKREHAEHTRSDHD
ncbi:sugar ABC transporter ATP-binding protein [Bifidobacterium tibiigranuli]|uniref:Sugar ABC transporter ATP-binding protein n=2 Tax=Bifidobacterium tibiigranuli TaxID=2172043 RepID=A0A5N6S5C5_9BIFI|nr:sugar ABC transporter ATP-binding protein [Bifidobacterium tibiigranuli]KAE8129908.1 D-xylose ABC transporter ATP-binding protein [Bifidobacterium tibiigranuli]